MALLFKHTYFKYFLLVFLILKVIVFVAEDISTTDTTQISYQLDIDDFENEVEDQKEFDESEQINQILNITYHFYQNNAVNKPRAIFKKYRIQYLEFTTPPPELV